MVAWRGLLVVDCKPLRERGWTMESSRRLGPWRPPISGAVHGAPCGAPHRNVHSFLGLTGRQRALVFPYGDLSLRRQRWPSRLGYGL